MVCQPSQTSSSRFGSRLFAMILVMSSMLRQVSGVLRIGAPLAVAVGAVQPRHDGRQLLASFGSAGAAITSDSLQQVELPALVGRQLQLVEARGVLRVRATASMNAWFARAPSASVSAVMKFCWTQPAWLASMPRASSLPSTSFRNAAASAAVGAPARYFRPRRQRAAKRTPPG